jgi:DNA-binding NtrC family response regulator
MNDIIISIISVVVTSVLLPLITLGGTKLIQLINQKIKDEKTRIILTGLSTIVERAVRSVTQTYVDSLKKSGKFDQEAQRIAFSLAKEEVLKELNQETRLFIETNYGNVNDFVTTQIESTINLIKSKSV